MSDLVHVTLQPDTSGDPFPAPGHWRTVKGVPMVMCDGGHYHRLVGWNVSEAGVVTPSVLCLMPGCGWHAMITLAGWM